MSRLPPHGWKVPHSLAERRRKKILVAVGREVLIMWNHIFEHEVPYEVRTASSRRAAERSMQRFQPRGPWGRGPAIMVAEGNTQSACTLAASLMQGKFVVG